MMLLTVADVVLRALSWDPAARFSSADEMEQALAAAAQRISSGGFSAPAYRSAPPIAEKVHATAPTALALSSSGAGALPLEPRAVRAPVKGDLSRVPIASLASLAVNAG